VTRPLPRPRPLKQYPRKRMTIAVGLLCDEGVLLCADTEQTSYLKTIGTKLFDIEADVGKVSFALSGDVHMAVSAIQDCEHRLKRISDLKTSISEVVERLLANYYAGHVLKLPKDERNAADYSFVVGTWSATEGARLHVTHKTAMHPSVIGSECVGAGCDLGQYLIRPYYFGPATKLADALLAAVSAVGRVKENVSYCGGQTQAVLMRKDGDVRQIDLFEVRQIEEYSKDYESRCRTLLTALYSANEENFNVALSSFQYAIAALRGDWERQRNALHARLTTLSGGYSSDLTVVHPEEK
jgi:20S proteasome alpha/beta subunit